MNKFDDRKNAFLGEHKFSEEQQFKIRNRANKKLADWVSSLCDLSEEQNKQLALKLIETDIIQTGQDLVVQTACDVLEQHGKHQTIPAIEEKLISFHHEASSELNENKK